MTESTRRKNRWMKCMICLLAIMAMMVDPHVLPMEASAAGTYTDTQFKGVFTTANLDAIIKKYELNDQWYWTTQAGVKQNYHGTKHPGWTWTSTNKGKTGYEKGWYGCRWNWDVVDSKNPNGSGWGECFGFAQFIGYLLSGYRNPQGNTEYKDKGDWKKYKTIKEAGGLKVGDIVRTNGHSAVVYSVNGDKALFIQAGGSSYNRLGMKRGYNYETTSITALGNRSDFKWIARAPQNVNPFANYTTTETCNAFYSKKGYSMNPQSGALCDTTGKAVSSTINTSIPAYKYPYDAADGNKETAAPQLTYGLLHVTGIVKNSKGTEWVKLANDCFIKKSEVELQYKISGAQKTGVYTANVNTQWGKAPFDAKGKGVDIRKGTKVAVARVVENKYGNLWYELDSVGSGRWVYSEQFTLDKASVTIDIDEDTPGTTKGVPSGKLTKGNGFGLRGIITASEKISSVVAKVYNLNTNSLATGLGTNPVTVSWNATTFNIQKSAINDNMRFAGLGNGAYRYEVTVTTVSGYSQTVISSLFTIGSGTMPTSTPKPVIPISAPTPTPKPQAIPGDVNGDGKVTGKDATRLVQWLAGWDVAINLTNADTNGDGNVTGRDATRLVQWLAGWDVELKYYIPSL